MKSKEAQRITGLTRKAMEYYEAQGLVTPTRDENGYRNYCEEDVSKLTKISAYRRLGLSLAEITNILSSGTKETLSNIVREKSIRHSLDEQRLSLLAQITMGKTLAEMEDELLSLESRETIYNRLSHKFPGYIGQMFFVNYAYFLQGRIETCEQQEAYEELICFLDRMEDLPFTEDELGMIQEASDSITVENLESIVESKLEAVRDTEHWLEENQDIIEEYHSLKNSEAYQAMPIVKLFDRMKNFLEESGYYERVIPLLER